jgi:SPP1 gp7 family putative phage head morphogenesis protein
MKPKFSSEKYNWAKNRSVVLHGKRLNYNVGIQQKYSHKLRKLVRKMTQETEKRLLKIFKGDPAYQYFEHQKKIAVTDDTIYNQSRNILKELNDKFKRLFNLHAKPAAENMLNNTITVSATSLNSSLKMLTGLSIGVDFIPKGLNQVIKASIAENVSLIKSIPDQYFSDLNNAVMRSITTGNGLKDLYPFIKKYNGQTERRAKNIAYDQTRKAYNQINKQRMMAVGFKKFKWLHSSGSQHPRALHIAMNGKVYSFNDLPIIDENTGEHGIPGQAINCKCTMTPVYEFGKE